MASTIHFMGNKLNLKYISLTLGVALLAAQQRKLAGRN